MPPVILLSEFVAAIQFGAANAVAFLETRTGRIVPPEESGRENSCPTPGHEPLPFVTDSDELAFARQFAGEVENPRDRQRLELASSAETCTTRLKWPYSAVKSRTNGSSIAISAWRSSRKTGSTPGVFPTRTMCSIQRTEPF